MHGVCLIFSVSILLVLAGFNHAHGLTTFGKTQSSNTNNQGPPPPIGKSCNNEHDCQAVGNTSCVPDPKDGRKKCLCGDNVPPINGACTTRTKGPGHSCNNNSECIEGSECMENEVNKLPAKLCKCSEGYLLEHYTCNGANQLSITTGIIMMTIARFLF